ncbi:hypothetical protein U9M48_035260 [Paspalum notatum var. saurae]|uniref:Uncharacterized protein n=1 Tax=Paspalum notatum var. saurae TaxID=547442 RepID=A0AAQ3UBT5_PASNO
MLDESDAILSVTRLTELVAQGRWRDARRYISRFLPLDTKRPTSVEAASLHLLIKVHGSLAAIVADAADGGSGAAGFQANKYLDHGSKTSNLLPGAIRLRSIMLNMLCSQQARDSIHWGRVTYVAMNDIVDLVYQTPELTDRVVLPASLMKPHNVLPIAAQFGNLSRRYHPKKQALRPKAPALVKHYLRTLRSLPDPSQDQEPYDERKTMSKALHLVADIVDNCLKASKRYIHPLQKSTTKGATVPPVSQTMFSSLACPAINTVMPSVANTVTDAGNSASHAPATDSPFMGTMRTSVSQTLFGNLTSHCGNSGIGLMANAGAAADPVSQIMFRSLACPINPWVPSVASAVINAGKLGSQVSTISPFLGTTYTPVNLDQKGCAAESGHQGLSTSKDPREEITSSDGQGYLKRRRMTEAFNEASLVPAIETRAEDSQGANLEGEVRRMINPLDKCSTIVFSSSPRTAGCYYAVVSKCHRS